MRSRPTTQTYQYYALLNPHTCPACLDRHGTLFSELAEAPPLHEGCRCAFLPVAPEELKESRERARRMRAKAQAERRRRELFRTALERLAHDPERALSCLEQAVAIDVHLEELEALHRRHRALLAGDPALTRRLRELFVQAHFDKLDQPKYRWISPGLYAQLEQQGRQRIQALFADPVQE